MAARADARCVCHEGPDVFCAAHGMTRREADAVIAAAAAAGPPGVKQAFELHDPRGFSLRAFYTDEQNARIVITRDGRPFRDFSYPAYRIWNIAAHFGDIVDDIVNNEAQPGADAASATPTGEAE